MSWQPLKPIWIIRILMLLLILVAFLAGYYQVRLALLEQQVQVGL